VLSLTSSMIWDGIDLTTLILILQTQTCFVEMMRSVNRFVR
jgi:hypothetical protein